MRIKNLCSIFLILLLCLTNCSKINSANAQTCTGATPILCSDNTCAATALACPCPTSFPTRCPDGTCAISQAACLGGGGITAANGKAKIVQVLRNLNVARNNLSRSSKAARSFSLKVATIIKTIKGALDLGGDVCNEGIITALDDLNELLDDLDEKVCDPDALLDRKAKQTCIPEDAADDFREVAQEATDTVNEILATDNDIDTIPDVCGKVKGKK